MVSLPLFVYGTLRDPDILAAVLTHQWPEAQSAPAKAPGYRVIAYPGRTYPALVTAPQDTATGLLLSGLSAPDLARLDAFEGDEYHRATIAVLSAATPILAFAYLPVIAIAKQSAWSIERWTHHHKTAMLLDLTAMAAQDELPIETQQ